jgi:hypothetical protein
MRDHDGFGAAVSGCSEQFERAATLGIGLLARYWLGHLTLEELGDKMLAELRRV